MTAMRSPSRTCPARSTPSPTTRASPPASSTTTPTDTSRTAPAARSRSTCRTAPATSLITQTDTIDNARIFGDVLIGVGLGPLRPPLRPGVRRHRFRRGRLGHAQPQQRHPDRRRDFRRRGRERPVQRRPDGRRHRARQRDRLAVLHQQLDLSSATSRAPARGAMSLSVDNSTVNNLADGTLNLSSMSLANNARIGIVIDNARIAGNMPNFNVAGTADIAANTRVHARSSTSSPTRPSRCACSTPARSTSAARSPRMISRIGPFLYNAELVQPNPNAIDLVLEVKNAHRARPQHPPGRRLRRRARPDGRDDDVAVAPSRRSRRPTNSSAAGLTCCPPTMRPCCASSPPTPPRPSAPPPTAST